VRKSKRMGWAEGRLQKISWGYLKEEERLDEVGGDGRIILKLILMNRRRGVDWNNLICNRSVTILNIGHTSECRAPDLSSFGRLQCCNRTETTVHCAVIYLDTPNVGGKY
jgi:hypothetical protein